MTAPTSQTTFFYKTSSEETLTTWAQETIHLTRESCWKHQINVEVYRCWDQETFCQQRYCANVRMNVFFFSITIPFNPQTTGYLLQKCNIFMKLVWYNKYLTALWILMSWCFSTGAAAASAGLPTHAFPVVYGLTHLPLTQKCIVSVTILGSNNGLSPIQMSSPMPNDC